jgi:hypothetical protein
MIRTIYRQYPSNQNTGTTSNVTFSNVDVTNTLNTRVFNSSETVETKDNIILLNKGQTGSEISTDESGVEIDRGTGSKFRMVFNKIKQFFIVGFAGTEQRVATCEDAPIDTAFAYYDSATKKFVTDTNVKRSISGRLQGSSLAGVNNIYTPKLSPLSGTVDLILGQLSTGRKTQIGRSVGGTFESQLSVNDSGDIEQTKVMQTVEGGIAIKLLNNTGATLLRGYLVSVDSSGDGRVKLTPIDVPDSIGVVYQDIPNGQSGWIVVSGMAYVIYANNATRGQFARSCKTGDAGAAAGKSFSEAVPTPPTSDTHFFENGHVLESKVAGQLVLTALHFN